VRYYWCAGYNVLGWLGEEGGISKITRFDSVAKAYNRKIYK
jgi:hypothetical protein